MKKANGWVAVIHGTYTTTSEGGVANGSRYFNNNFFRSTYTNETINLSFPNPIPHPPKGSHEC